MYEHAIASRKRREVALRAVQPASRAPRTSMVKGLGISVDELDFIERTVGIQFFEEAALPRTVELDWESSIRSRNFPDRYVDQAMTLDFTKSYVLAIGRAVRRLADLLVIAALSRMKKPKITPGLTEAIWREGLDFASRLGEWEPFATWVDKVIRFGWSVPQTADGALDRQQLEEAVKERREFFEKRITMNWSEWLGEIDSAIELRRVVSFGKSTRSGREDRLKSVIGVFKAKYPLYTQLQLAGVVDGHFDKLGGVTPLPERWKKFGPRTLVEALRNSDISGAAKKFISVT